MHRVLALCPGKASGEAVRRLGHGLAVRVQDRDDDHGEQELDEQQAETAHLADEPEYDPAGEGREASGHLFRTGRRKMLPTFREPGTDRRDAGQPRGGLGEDDGSERLRPVRDLPGVLHDRREAEVERHQQDQEQRDRHDRDGKRTPAAEPRLRVQQERPRRDRDHDRPRQRHQERAHDPEAAEHERPECDELEGRADEVLRPVGLHAVRRPPRDGGMASSYRGPGRESCHSTPDFTPAGQALGLLSSGVWCHAVRGAARPTRTPPIEFSE